MNKTFDELKREGNVGKLFIWIFIINLAMPVATACFSLYWMVLTANTLWLKAIGGNIFTANFFLLLTSLLSIVLLLLTKKGVKLIYPKFNKQLFVAVTCISGLIGCILLSLSTVKKTDRYYQSISDYLTRNPTETWVTKFHQDNPSDYTRNQFVLIRSRNANESFAPLFGIYIIAFALLIIFDQHFKRGTSLVALNPNEEIESPEQPSELSSNEKGSFSDNVAKWSD